LFFNIIMYKVQKKRFLIINLGYQLKEEYNVNFVFALAFKWKMIDGSLLHQCDIGR
jgi:hypothetical protein